MLARRLLTLAAACILGMAAGRAEEVKQEKATPSGPAEGQPWTVPDLALELVPIQPGTFYMGSPMDEPHRCSNEDQHTVALTKPFWIGTYEVTQEEFEKIMGNNPSQFKGPRRPVEQVNWEDASAFCYKLTAAEKMAGRLPAGYEYRLPTEAEWEYCCRAGSNDAYCFGPDAGLLRMYGWSCGCSTHEVGQRKPNAWGIYDMHGNVLEWCQDLCYPAWHWQGTAMTDTYRNGVKDPVCRQGSDHVGRGGGWFFGDASCRAASRGSFGPTGVRPDFGFRVVLATVTEVSLSAGPKTLPTEPPLVGDWAAAMPIFDAVDGGDAAEVKALLDRDPRFANARIEGGETPLHRAVQGTMEIAELLIARGAKLDVNTAGGCGGTPLHYAIRMAADVEMIEFLISKGARVVDVRDNLGGTPLEWAARFGNMTGAEVLIKKGADINAEDYQGYTALHAAAMERHMEMVDFLCRQDPVLARPGTLVNAVLLGDPNQVREALRKTPGVLTIKDHYGFTPMLWAVCRGRKDIAELLLAEGADTTAKVGNGWTALYLAVELGKWDIAELLRNTVPKQ